MEYVFGTKSSYEILKTKGDKHTDLTGFQEIIRDFTNEKISDFFRVVRKIESKEDSAGNCYDWYEIDHHYREIDRTEPIRDAEAKNIANIDYISMMSGIDLPENTETEDENA